MREKTQDTFILRIDFYPQIKMLDREQRGDLLTAVFAYSAGEELPEMDQVTRMCFGFIKASLDANAERYQAKCAKNRQNGGRGGRPAEKPNCFSENRTVSKKTERLNEKPNGFSGNPIDLDSESDLDSDFDNDSLSLRSREAPASAVPTEAERENFFRIFFLRNFRNPQAEVDRFIAFYQATGWTRKGQRIVDRTALARSWTEKESAAGPPFPVPFMKCWGEIYDVLGPRADCSPLFRELRAVQITPERQIILTARTSTALPDLLERHVATVKPIIEKYYPRHALHYRVPRKTKSQT